MAASPAKKLGRLALTIIVLGSIVILFSLAMLLFLWIATRSNSTWEVAIFQDWLTNAVTIFSEALKQAINFQIGLCAAMLSAIALERFAVLLPEIASCLAFRNDYSPWNAAMLFWKAAPRKGHVVGIQSRRILLLAFVLVCVTCITQVFSIILVSDIGFGQIAGLPRINNVPYGFEWAESAQTTSQDLSKRWIVQVSSGQIVSTLGLTPSPTSHSNIVTNRSKREIVQVSDSQIVATNGVTLTPTATASAGVDLESTSLGISQTSTTTSTSGSSSFPSQSAQASPTSATGADTSETSTSSSEAASSSSSSASDSASYDDYCSNGVAVSAGGFAPHSSDSIARCAPVVERKSSWSQEPFFYPTFAEYHEDAPK